eukprot:14456557-Alexandrium_andersonii.AAC.1
MASIGWVGDLLSPPDAHALLARWNSEHAQATESALPRVLAPWRSPPPRPGRYWSAGRARFKRSNP